MPSAPAREAEILTLPPDLTSNQFGELEQVLQAWEQQVRENAQAFPARSFELGRAQIEAFMGMLGRVGLTNLPPHSGPGMGPSQRAAVEWQKRYTLHELGGALDKYLDEIKSAALYGLRGSANPTQVASWLHKATNGAAHNWRTVARTEMVRANAAGRYHAIRAMGIDKCWFPRHAGACPDCRRLLEGRVFDIDEIEHATNYGRKRQDWIACCPCHPQCTHTPLPYLSDVYDQAQAEYDALERTGLDDPAVNAMFDSSGQIKPQHAKNPRIRAFLEQVGKAGYLLPAESAVMKARREEPPGLHHTSGRRNCAGCEHYRRPECTRYNWQVDPDELCSSWTAEGTVGKGFFDNPQPGLDPLLWTKDQRLRADVRDRIVNWWRHTFTDDAPLWSRLFITGSAASIAWAGKTAGDVDVQLVVNYDELRKHHGEYRTLSDPELHAALLTQLKASLEGVEAANGLPIDAFVRPQHTVPAFVASVRGRGQGVYDLSRAKWIVAPPAEPFAEDVDGGEILEGEGGDLALKHPDWLVQARQLRDAIGSALDEYDQAPTAARLDELQRTYTYVHDLRQAAFTRGDGADSLGNFVWRYLMDHGPLARLKHLLTQAT